MQYDQIVMRYGDLTMKGRNRNMFEQKMLKQVKHALSGYPALDYWKTYGRMYIKLNGQDHGPVMERLKDIFGIVSFSPVVVCKPELADIEQTALKLMRSLPAIPQTFKMNVRRVWKQFPHGSHEMNHLIGAPVLREFPELSVNVKQPELELRVDIQEEAAYVFCEVIPASGGFPFGSNGKAMLQLSGGIDSPVAGWMGLRKGLEIEAVHFHSYPYTSRQAQDKVIELAKRLAYYSAAPIKLHMVSFTEIQTELAKSKQNHLLITMMRRAMLRITEKLALEHGAKGIVTGESLGQVASQTLSSMNVIGRATVLPLIKPLIMMDKQEIINIATRIKTYETSILPFEDCCTLFIPKTPSTNPSLRVVEGQEAALEDLPAMIERAVQTVETLIISAETLTEAVTAGEEDWF
ncbi:tRNA uracil 4-sulfurtransferase ThiI [Paenibacillus yanchengensis]|uniref:Probable tRNA sulfurtransferase n=1 Tax=Paenibacillus yanchengensis TaxID=2035833 RepID=A0ABW4YKP9_9BACL